MTVVKLLHQTEEAHKHNIENRTQCLKIKSNGVIVSQNYPITDYQYYKFLHDKDKQSDNNYNFLHDKTYQITVTGFCMYLTRAITD